MDNPASLLAALQNRLYQQAPERHGISGAFLKALAVFLAVVRDLAFGQLMLRATSLVYTTLLSIVPMLALTFSVSKAFGVHGQIEPALQRFMEPLGPKGAEITTNIMRFIDNMHVGVLGSVGLGMLLFTAVSTILKIESAINTIWHVKTMRPLSQRISYYLCVMLLGPILVVSALGLNATLASSNLVQMIISVEPFGHLAVLAGRLLPYVLVIGLFLFLYLFMPNTRVRLLPALTSALVAGICWQSAGWAFARFVAGSTQYAAIYSSLAILIIFMIWLYVSWIVVLVGASVGFYMQHTECLMAPPGEEPHLSAQSQDQLALAIMQALGERYLQGSAALRTEELARRFHTPGYAVDGILEALAAHGIVVRLDKSEPTTWMPGRDLSNITPWQVLEAVRHAGGIHPPEPDAERIIQTFSYAQDQMSAVLSTISFRDLLTQPPRDRQAVRSGMAHGIGSGLHTAPG
ncbi:MAG: YhjD/YihY/BrkB family envelope integrity protein, partial [Lautropia mirabilis]